MTERRWIPDGYHTVTPYLIVTGAPQLIDFLTKAFGAKEAHRQLRPDGTIMHADLIIGDSHIMMAEATDQYPTAPSMLHLYLPDVDAAYERALAAGATPVRPPTTESHGDRLGGVKDPSGNEWWVASHQG